jgi:hypothetical protein
LEALWVGPTRFRVVVDLAVVVELAVDIDFLVVDSAVVVGGDGFEVFVDVE